MGRRHGIVPARMQRMATADAADRKPAALDRAEARNRGHRVLRTRRHKAAVRTQPGAEPAFVTTQDTDEKAIDHDVCRYAAPLRKRAVAAVGPAGYNSALSRLKGTQGSVARGSEKTREEGRKGRQKDQQARRR